MTPYTMDDVLKDETLFSEKFCAKATLKHLGDVPVEALRMTIQMIHACSGFHAAATPERYTDNTEMPVVIFGNLTSDGQMRTPRFGLTTQCSTSNHAPGKGLFLYVSDKALQAVQGADTDLEGKTVSSWFPWRRNTSDPSRAMPVPVYEMGSSLDTSFMLPGSNEGVALGGLLDLLGSQLNLSRNACGAFAGITKELDLASNCITPKAVEIMRARRR